MSSSSSGKKVMLNSLIYSISGLLLKCFSFFLLPLYTLYLTTSDYGISSLATSFISTMGFVVSFSLFSAIMRFYVDLKDEPEKLSRFYGTVVVFILISGIFFGLLLTLLRHSLMELVFPNIDFYPIVVVVLVSLVFYCLHMVFDNILRSQQKAMKSTLFSFLFFFISVGLNILFVVIYRYGVLGTLLASMFAYMLYAGYFIIEMSIKKTIRFCFDVSLLREALKYSIPIMPHNLSTQIALFVSKIFIGGTVAFGGLGIYTVATQFGNVADTIQSYVDNAYGPWLYEKLHSREEGYKKTIREVIRLLTSVIGLFFLGISLFAHDYIVLFIDKSYIEAWRYVPLIVSVFSIKTMYYFYVEVLFYYKEASKKLFWATLTSSFLNILLSYWAIPILGINGSILADAVSMFVRVLIIVAISRRYEDIGLRIRDFLLNFVIIECFIFAGLFLSYWKYNDVFSVQNFLYKVGVVVAYILLITVLNRNQMRTLRKYIKTKFAGKRG